MVFCLAGQEAKALGIHVQLGPVAGALGKIPHVSYLVAVDERMEIQRTLLTIEL